MITCDSVLDSTLNIDKAHKVVVSLSGGLDSSILLHLMVRKFGKDNVHALSFNYNQRHDVELHCATYTTQQLGVTHKVVDVSFLGDIAKDVSAMVKGSVATPDVADVARDSQPVTYMPNRNMILASITAGYAEAVGADGIALGIQAIDSYCYWDTTPEFYSAIENVLLLNRKHRIYFLPAFLHLSKADEIQLGIELKANFKYMWTCYNPTIPVNERVIAKTYIPCGVCPSCAERLAAFRKAGVEDPNRRGVVVSVDGLTIG